MNTPAVKTALLSYGMSGRLFHAPFLKAHQGFILHGCWERKPGHFKKDFPEARIYQSLDEVLDDPETALVIVNTPNATHFDYAAKALAANKHVLVEKPLTLNAGEAIVLKELAGRNNKLLSVYHNRRWDGDFITVKKIIDSGSIGTVVSAELHADRYRPALSSKIHKENAEPGAGLLLDWGPHMADQAMQLFGMPQRVFCHTAITRPGSVVDDLFDITLFYPKHTVRLKSSFFVMHSPASFLLHGTKGSYIQQRSNIQEIQLNAGKSPMDDDFGIDPIKGLLHQQDDSGNMISKEVPLSGGNYLEFYNRLFNAIRFGEPLPVSTEEAIGVMKILDAAAESNHTGKIVAIS